jgi:hypothetical protein
MRHVLGWLGRAGFDERRSRRGLKYSKILTSKPRLTGIKDISEAKRTMKTTHVALDAV